MISSVVPRGVRLDTPADRAIFPFHYNSTKVDPSTYIVTIMNLYYEQMKSVFNSISVVSEYITERLTIFLNHV